MRPTRSQLKTLPTLGEALYEPPNAQMTAKSCGNCGLWSRDSFCALFGDRAILSFDVCGYHVAGEPAKKRIRLPIVPLEPRFAGLAWAPFGTRCGTCLSFREGICIRIKADKGAKFAQVEPYGCCALYTGAAVNV